MGSRNLFNHLVAGSTALAALLMPAGALAHKPSFGDEGMDSPDNAYPIEDPSVSIVVYRPVTCERPELWMELSAEDGFGLYVQLLTPRIERLADYRPSLAVVGPGLPEAPADLEIAVPDGMGAIVYRTEDVTPTEFDEPFTGTQDWMLLEDTVVLPQPGTFYVVAWDPRGQTGKLAVAVGTIEQFGLDDFAAFDGWRQQTRTFHETPDFPPPEPIEEVICSSDDGSAAQDAPAAAADTPSAAPDADADASGTPIEGAAVDGAASPSGGEPSTDPGMAGAAGGPAPAEANSAPDADELTADDTGGPESSSGGCSAAPAAATPSPLRTLALALPGVMLLVWRRRRQRD